MERFNPSRQTNFPNSQEYGRTTPADLGDAVRSYYNICQVCTLDGYRPVGFHGKVWGYLVDGRLEDLEHNIQPSRHPKDKWEAAFFQDALEHEILWHFRVGNWPYEADDTERF